MFQLNLYSFKAIHLFLAYIILFDLIIFISNYFILNESFYYSALVNQFEYQRITDFVEFNKKYQYFSYLILPVTLLLKWFILSGVLYVGVFLYNQEISFKSCFKIIMISELVMVVVAIVRVGYFLFVSPKSLQDVQNFYPLSLMQLFAKKQIPSYLVFTIQQINLFEVAYWYFIIKGIKTFTQNSFSFCFKITASSYGVSMLIWVLVIMFIQLQFS